MRYTAIAAAVLAMGVAGVAPARLSAQETAGTFDASGVYRPSADEQALDCRKLTGRMTVRILQVRAEISGGTTSASVVAQTMQQVTNPVLKLMFGGASSYSGDRRKRLTQDVARLEAYNGLLAGKGCATFDLQAELNKGPSDPTPRPR